MKTQSETQRSTWWIPTLLILLSLVPAIAGGARVAQLGGDTIVTPATARFHESPGPIVIHIVAVVIYSMLGAFQFSPSFRQARPGWHRSIGRVLIPAGLLAALSGLWMTITYPWPAGDGFVVYVERLIAGTAMLAAIIIGLDAIRRRDFSSHGNWMMRAYALGLGAGTQVLTHLPWFILVDRHPGEGPRAVMMGAAWVINVLFAEFVIRRPRLAPGQTQLRPLLAAEGATS